VKLAEALMKRKDIIKEIKKVEEEVLNNIVHFSAEEANKEGEVVHTKVLSLYSALLKDLEYYNTAIEKTNRPIAHNIKAMQLLDREISFYNQIRKKVINKNNDVGMRIYKEPATLYSAITVEDINALIKVKEAKRRSFDKKVQEFNWVTDLEDV